MPQLHFLVGLYDATPFKSLTALVIGEVSDSRTAAIFIWDTAYFHCDPLNEFTVHAVSRMNMPAVRESATSLFCDRFV